MAGSLRDGGQAFDMMGWRTTGAAAPAAYGLGALQISPPDEVLRATQPGVDEAIDGLVADDPAAGIERQSAGDGLGRPAQSQPIEHAAGQHCITLQPLARPAPRLALLVGIRRLVADLAAGVALQLPRDRRCRAIQSCRDLPERVHSPV